MLPLALATLALVVSAAPTDMAPPPPLPPLLEDTEGEAGEDEDRMEDPADEATPPPAAAPRRERIAPPRAHEAPPAAPGQRFSLDETTLLIAQLAGIAAVGLLLAPINYYATLLTCGLWPCIVWPVAVSYGVTWSGDAFGPGRAGVLWPLIASAGTGTGMLVLAGGGVLLAAFAGGAIGGFAGPFAGVLIIPVAILVIGGLFCGPAISGMAAALAYYLTAEPKQPGDTGGGFPGLIDPAHPAPRTARAMRY